MLDRWHEAEQRARCSLGYGEYGYIEDYNLYMDTVKNIFSDMSKEWHKNYVLYQKTNQWKILRKVVFTRDKNICQDCGGEAQCIHHLSYENMMCENESEDCIALCNICHMKMHNLKIGINENNVFIGECYLCNEKRPIFRVDSWSGKKLSDGSYLRGSWRNFCMDCLREMNWYPNREFNKCIMCYSDFIGRKNQAKCRGCWNNY